MKNLEMQNELFKSLMTSISLHNKQLSEVGMKNLENFTKLLGGTGVVGQNLFNNDNKNFSNLIDVKSPINQEKIELLNSIVKENIANLTKLCESSNVVAVELKDLTMKVIDFYVQLYPSRETYDIASNFKKVLADGNLLNCDYNSLVSNFIGQMSKNWQPK
mgnify:FL=1